MIPRDLDTALRNRAAAWNAATQPNLVADFATLAECEGIEFATAVLHDRLLRVDSNARFLRQAEAAQRSTKVKADVIGVVPGAFHRQHPHTGADGARILRIARELGCAAEAVPIGSLGTLADNARAIREWLATHSGKRIALLSLSKGSADVKHALAAPDSAKAFADVCAWVSLSGLVQGTPLISWLRRRPLRWWSVRAILWWHGLSIRALRELDHGPATALHCWPAIPDTMRVVHVYGFPLAQHLAHRWSPRGYKRLAPLGPNDGGGVLLADLASLPGIVCPIWGADHYLTPPWDAHSLLRGIVSAAVAPEDFLHANQLAIPPMAVPATKSST